MSITIEFLMKFCVEMYLWVLKIEPFSSFLQSKNDEKVDFSDFWKSKIRHFSVKYQVLVCQNHVFMTPKHIQVSGKASRNSIRPKTPILGICLLCYVWKNYSIKYINNYHKNMENNRQSLDLVNSFQKLGITTLKFDDSVYELKKVFKFLTQTVIKYRTFQLLNKINRNCDYLQMDQL